MLLLLSSSIYFSRFIALLNPNVRIKNLNEEKFNLILNCARGKTLKQLKIEVPWRTKQIKKIYCFFKRFLNQKSEANMMALRIDVFAIKN
jgi:hypothetical protein